MKRAPRKKSEAGTAADRATERLIRTLVASFACPAEALELRYWSKEPGLIGIIRAIVTMPEETRAALEAFIALARDCKSVTATLDRRGMLTLASAEAAKTLALAHHAASDESEDAPRLLN